MLVSKVELKVDAEVEEDDDDDDEACCKIRVRASNRLVKCTVVALSTASNSLRSPNLCVNSPGIESSVSSMSMTQRTSWSSLISVGMMGEGGAMMGYILGGMVDGRTGWLGHL